MCREDQAIEFVTPHVCKAKYRESGLFVKHDHLLKVVAQLAGIEMDIDESDAGTAVGGSISDAEQFTLLKRATRDMPTDYTAHLNLVTYLRKERPGSLDLLKAREE